MMSENDFNFASLWRKNKLGRRKTKSFEYQSYDYDDYDDDDDDHGISIRFPPVPKNERKKGTYVKDRESFETTILSDFDERKDTLPFINLRSRFLHRGGGGKDDMHTAVSHSETLRALKEKNIFNPKMFITPTPTKRKHRKICDQKSPIILKELPISKPEMEVTINKPATSPNMEKNSEQDNNLFGKEDFFQDTIYDAGIDHGPILPSLSEDSIHSGVDSVRGERFLPFDNLLDAGDPSSKKKSWGNFNMSIIESDTTVPDSLDMNDRVSEVQQQIKKEEIRNTDPLSFKIETDITPFSERLKYYQSKTKHPDLAVQCTTKTRQAIKASCSKLTIVKQQDKTLEIGSEKHAEIFPSTTLMNNLDQAPTTSSFLFKSNVMEDINGTQIEKLVHGYGYTASHGDRKSSSKSFPRSRDRFNNNGAISRSLCAESISRYYKIKGQTCTDGEKEGKNGGRTNEDNEINSQGNITIEASKNNIDPAIVVKPATVKNISNVIQIEFNTTKISAQPESEVSLSIGNVQERASRFGAVLQTRGKYGARMTDESILNKEAASFMKTCMKNQDVLDAGLISNTNISKIKSSNGLTEGQILRPNLGKLKKKTKVGTRHKRLSSNLTGVILKQRTSCSSSTVKIDTLNSPITNTVRKSDGKFNNIYCKRRSSFEATESCIEAKISLESQESVNTTPNKSSLRVGESFDPNSHTSVNTLTGVQKIANKFGVTLVKRRRNFNKETQNLGNVSRIRPGSKLQYQNKIGNPTTAKTENDTANAANSEENTNTEEPKHGRIKIKLVKFKDSTLSVSARLDSNNILTAFKDGVPSPTNQHEMVKESTQNDTKVIYSSNSPHKQRGTTSIADRMKTFERANTSNLIKHSRKRTFEKNLASGFKDFNVEKDDTCAVSLRSSETSESLSCDDPTVSTKRRSSASKFVLLETDELSIQSESREENKEVNSCNIIKQKLSGEILSSTPVRFQFLPSAGRHSIVSTKIRSTTSQIMSENDDPMKIQLDMEEESKEVNHSNTVEKKYIRFESLGARKSIYLKSKREALNEVQSPNKYKLNVPRFVTVDQDFMLKDNISTCLSASERRSVICKPPDALLLSVSRKAMATMSSKLKYFSNETNGDDSEKEENLTQNSIMQQQFEREHNVSEVLENNNKFKMENEISYVTENSIGYRIGNEDDVELQETSEDTNQVVESIIKKPKLASSIKAKRDLFQSKMVNNRYDNKLERYNAGKTTFFEAMNVKSHEVHSSLEMGRKLLEGKAMRSMKVDQNFLGKNFSAKDENYGRVIPMIKSPRQSSLLLKEITENRQSINAKDRAPDILNTASKPGSLYHRRGLSSTSFTTFRSSSSGQDKKPYLRCF